MLPALCPQSQLPCLSPQSLGLPPQTELGMSIWVVFPKHEELLRAGSMRAGTSIQGGPYPDLVLTEMTVRDGGRIPRLIAARSGILVGVWFAVFRTSGLETLLDENYVQRPYHRKTQDPVRQKKKEKQNATDVFGNQKTLGSWDKLCIDAASERFISEPCFPQWRSRQ